MRLTDKVVIITGGAGFLGQKIGETVSEEGGIPVLIDIKDDPHFDFVYIYYRADITHKPDILRAKDEIMQRLGHIDVLINNAANNPRIKGEDFEDFSLEIWNDDFDVGLTGALICTQVFGKAMEKGSIINIGSVYGMINPHEDIYDKPKPVSYVVVKAGLIALTKYTAVHWAKKNIRCNIVSFAGFYEKKFPRSFVRKLSKLIPMGRMADINEIREIIIFLASDASSYMTGSNLVMDGGMTSW